MGLSLRLGPSQTLAQVCAHSHPGGLRKYVREALKAFRKFTLEGKTFYTCNVERLKQCDRLGSEKEVTLWRTHFFLASRHFDDVFAVVFSKPPGSELVQITRQMQIQELYLALNPTEILDASNGSRINLNEPLVFASADKAEVFPAGTH